MECSGKRQNGPAARCRYMRLQEGLICLLVLFIQFPGTVPAVMEIMQPMFAVGVIGQRTSFNCRLIYSGGTISRVHLYLYIMNASNEMEVIHPSINGTYKKKLSISNNNSQTAKSIQISDLDFNDTKKYYCKMSVVFQTSYLVTGNGTLLFVHGPLNLKKENDTTLVCEMQVRMVEDVEIVWTDEGTEIAAEISSVEPADFGTYRMISRLSVHSEPNNPGLTTNITCLVRHKSGGHITQQSMTISGRFFAQKLSREEPTLLYVLTLASRMLLLIAVLVFFKVQNRSQKQRHRHRP